MGELGRRVPTDWRHVERYPLRALAVEDRPRNVPVPIGVNWYQSFDLPVHGSDRRFRVGLGDLGRVRGGHCVCLLPRRLVDTQEWWRYYNQLSEGACVGAGCSRAMSLLNRRRYDFRWLYRAAQSIDEWDDTPPQEGTSVRAGLEILRTVGHSAIVGRNVASPHLAQGISAYRWARDVQEVLDVLDRPNALEVPFLNSWGHEYPHVTWMPTVVLERLLHEDGELPVITDR